MNTQLHAVTDRIGRPIRVFISAGHISDYTGARVLAGRLPAAGWLLGPFRDLAPQDPIGRRIVDMMPTDSAKTL